MKVKELVEQLQKLDQEKNIWVLYDQFDAQEPNFIQCDEEDLAYEDGDIAAGDFVHEAW